MFEQLKPFKRGHCLASGTTQFIEELEPLSSVSRADFVLCTHLFKRRSPVYAVRFTRTGSAVRLVGSVVQIPPLFVVNQVERGWFYV